MATKNVNTIKAVNTGLAPIRIAIKPTKRSNPIFNAAGGQVVLNPGKSVVAEEERFDLSHLENLAKLGSMKSTRQVVAVEIPDPIVQTLDLSFTYAIAGPATSMEPDAVITGLTPSEFNFSEIVVTNDGDLDADVTAAVISPGASSTSINGFSGSTIANGGTNSFNINWGSSGGGPFDEDLTITINGVDYLFTFQGEIQGGAN